MQAAIFPTQAKGIFGVMPGAPRGLLRAALAGATAKTAAVHSVVRHSASSFLPAGFRRAARSARFPPAAPSNANNRSLPFANNGPRLASRGPNPWCTTICCGTRVEHHKMLCLIGGNHNM